MNPGWLMLTWACTWLYPGMQIWIQVNPGPANPHPSEARCGDVKFGVTQVSEIKCPLFQDIVHFFKNIPEWIQVLTFLWSSSESQLRNPDYHEECSVLTYISCSCIIRKSDRIIIIAILMLKIHWFLFLSTMYNCECHWPVTSELMPIYSFSFNVLQLTTQVAG